jgi:A/G-specific adenine glycosylase
MPAQKVPLPALRRKLLTWFDREQRSLPWRANRDPYRIWVSEVMLQQTTVAAVISYFERFLTAFPTLAALAEADEQEVLKLWQGLGYYRRARHLHAAAKQLVLQHNGSLPDDPAVWTELPGVGRYILGAVLSQAFDRRLPIVEANSLRVLSRWFGSRLDPRAGDGKRWVWGAAETVLPRKRTGDFNQAMMELGALICTPDAPNCSGCPVRTECEAHRLGIQHEVPPKLNRAAATGVDEVALIVRDGKRVLLGQNRLDAERWANMWELPRAERQADEDETSAAVRIAKTQLGLTITVGAKIAVVRHTVTRFRITLSALEALQQTGEIDMRYYKQVAWVNATEQHEYPMGTPHRKLLGEVLKPNLQIGFC